MTVIVQHYAGSLAYGTNLPTSDVDIRGIYCAPKEDIMSPFRVADEFILPEEEDGKLFELGKYVHKYASMNPNILETLWVEESDIITGGPVYDYLRSMRSELLTQKIGDSFVGYAMQQVKRMKGHKKWINKPQPVEPPVRRDYLKMIQNFREEKIFSKQWKVQDWNEDHVFIHCGNDIYLVVAAPGYRLLNADCSIHKAIYEDLPEELKKAKPEFIVKMCEAEYKAAKQTHTQYWTWKRERNPARAALEEASSYDTKNAMHTVRLMRMGAEVLREGVLQVKRPDAEELLAIRNGSWSYEELLAYAESMKNDINALKAKSSLPKEMNVDLAQRVLQHARDMVWES